MSGPTVHITHEYAHKNGKLQVLHIAIGLISGWYVIEHEKQTGNAGDNKEVER